ncbi:MAG TPA: ion transporter [Candidatus Avipropionibacterium avicola]|uniref:Ion transporter n=1 Tax=Candidatus Avipropionibacterium avicola TaxID=2840701 RepID=A0A9D1H1P7_9ACTN|nr:ion transporter [Candidatus Avipropionibacterium avicola]
MWRVEATEPAVSTVQPSQGLQERVTALVDSRGFVGFIIGLIIANAVMIGLHTYPAIGGHPAMEWLDGIVLAIFTVEIVLRIFAHRKDFFRDPWSWFDLFVVAVSYVPSGGTFQILRVLRVLRVLRLLSAVPSLRKVVNALITAVPGIASIGALLVIIMYVFVVATTMLFGPVSPEFGSLGDSTVTLFRLLIGDGWAVMETIGDQIPYAWPFMMVYAVISTFVILNLFIAVTTEALQGQREVPTEPTPVEQRILDELAGLRAEVDRSRADRAGSGPTG